MPLKRSQLERQIAAAQEDLAAWEKKLDEKGVAAKARRKEPKWRKLDANCRQLKTRLYAVAAIEKREQELAAGTAGSSDE